MTLNERAAPSDSIGRDPIEQLTSTMRELVDATLVVEYRLAALAALVGGTGTSYTERATRDLQEATDGIAEIESRRRWELSAAADLLGADATDALDSLIELAPDRLRAALTDARAELDGSRRRIDKLRTTAEEVLGRRITLIAEVLSNPEDRAPAIYGRPHRPRPRRVSADL
jgi:hypothetical protein